MASADRIMENALGESTTGLRLRALRTTNDDGFGPGRISPPNHESAEEPVSPAGRMFQEPNINCVIVCTLGFKEKSDMSSVRGVLKEGLLRHYRFRSRVVSSRTENRRINC